MSFSFRNIFSPDDSEFGNVPDSKGAGGLSSPGAMPQGRGNLSGEPPVAGPSQTFLVSELLPYIPKAIAAQSGIPMTKEVRVPVPADGSLDVRLSSLYQICPELFAAEITPLNDSMVTLPPRLGATPETPSAAVGQILTKPSPTGSGDFDASANPFWSPVVTGSAAHPSATPPFPIPEKPAASAGSTAAFSWSTPSSPKENPFSAEPAPAAKETSVSWIPPLPGAPKIAGGFDGPATPVAGGGAGSGSAVLPRTPSSGFVGFSEAPPAKGEGGAVAGPSLKNHPEGQEVFSTLFSKQAEADAMIPYPGNPAFAGAAPPSKPSEPEGVWGAMFSGAGFGEDEAGTNAADPFESIGNLLNPAKPAAPAAETLAGRSATGDAFSGFEPSAAPVPAQTGTGPDPDFAFAAGFTAFAPASAEEPKKQHIADAMSADPFAGLAGPSVEPTVPASSMNPVSSAFAPFQTVPPIEALPGMDPSFPAQGFGAPATAPEAVQASPDHLSVPRGAAGNESPSPAAPFASFTPVNEHPVAPPVPEVLAAPVATAVPEVREEPVVRGAMAATEEVVPVFESHPAPAVPVPSAPPCEAIEDELRDLELRAIFSTSEVFTFSKVARKVVGLPGINSCSLSAPGKLIQASRREESRLGNEAREMVATLRSLAKLTGLPEARTFTLQTDRGIVSLFLEGDCCVTVHHDSPVFQPGVREKLILVARSLAKLRE